MAGALPDQLENTELTGVVLSREELSAHRMADCQATAWRLIACGLNEWEIVDGNLEQLCAWDSRLTNWHVDHCLTDHTTFQQCTLEHWRVHSSFFNNTHLESCQMTDLAAELSSFGQSTFSACRLHGNRLSEVAMIGTCWYDTELIDEQYNFVRFPAAVFINTQFRGCLLKKAIFRRATFINCRFESCDLTDAVFHNAFFTDTEFIDTSLEPVANMEGVTGLELS